MKIRMEHITKQFKNTVAVSDMNCVIPDGEMVCLLGPSGCGKSTTLSMIAGLEQPTEGEIYFDDTPMSDIAAEKRDIGMVFQNYALYPHMSVLENIMFPLKMRRIPKAERVKRAKEMAQMMQITALLHRKPAQLSGGQQQRVAIARALVKQPKILLLDEPFSNLDARLRIELRDEIRSLQKKVGITTVFVTHDQEEAMSISDRILLMNRGVVQQYSSPQEMYRCPKNVFVAGFLGNPPMNFFPCRYREGVVSLPDSCGWNLSSAALTVSQEVCGDALLGIRPEDFEVVSEKEQLCASVTSVQTLGKELYLKLSSGELRFTACLNWDHNYQPGDNVRLRIKKAYLFPATAQPSEQGGSHES